MTQTRPPRRYWGSFLFGLFVGWTVGAAVGILKAPRSGAQTRALINAEAERYLTEIALQVQERGRHIAAALERDPLQEAIEEGKAAARRMQAGDEAAPVEGGPDAENL